jgi:hypothetical protein
MRSIVLRALIGAIVGAIIWLVVGRQLSTVLDRFVTVRLRTLPVSPLSCRFGTILIGDVLLSLSATPGERAIAVECDASDRVVVSVDGRALVLGALIRSSPGSDFAPDQGDQLSLTVDRSLLSWPTPLDLNFMTGHSPSWKRNLYYRLRWTKASGASFTAVWRFEQYFYGSDGWTGGMMTRAGSTGLIQAEIENDAP